MIVNYFIIRYLFYFRFFNKLPPFLGRRDEGLRRPLRPFPPTPLPVLPPPPLRGAMSRRSSLREFFFLNNWVINTFEYQSVYCFNFLKLFSNRTLRSNSYIYCSMQWSFKGEVCVGVKLHWFWSFTPKTECGSTEELCQKRVFVDKRALEGQSKVP